MSVFFPWPVLALHVIALFAALAGGLAIATGFSRKNRAAAWGAGTSLVTGLALDGATFFLLW